MAICVPGPVQTREEEEHPSNHDSKKWKLQTDPCWAVEGEAALRGVNSGEAWLMPPASPLLPDLHSCGGRP